MNLSLVMLFAAFILSLTSACSDSTINGGNEPGPGESTAQPSISKQPESMSVCVGDDVTFRSDAVGEPAPTVQWQEDSGAGYADMTGRQTTTLSLSAVTKPMDGNRYRAVYRNDNGETTTVEVSLTVFSSPSILDHPEDRLVTQSSSATFQAQALSAIPMSVTWQRDANDSNGWQDIPGRTSATLVVNNVTLAMDLYRFRAIFTNSCGLTITSTATLSVQ